MVLAVAGPASAQSVVADTAAKRYVGREVTVEGTVARVKPSRHQQTVFLNFGSDYPAHTFSVWVPDSARSRFGGDSALATLPASGYARAERFGSRTASGRRSPS